MEMNLVELGFATNLHLEWGEFLVLGYLDAGTGSLIFQILVASLVSAGVILGSVLTQVRGFFARVVTSTESSVVRQRAAAFVRRIQR